MVIQCTADGKAKMNDKQRAFFLEMPEGWRGRRVEVRLRVLKSKRSQNQNAYFHAAVIPFFQEMFERFGGEVYDANVVKEFLKQKFGAEAIVDMETGELVRVGKPTSDMNKEEFGNFLDAMNAWAFEMWEVELPDPEKYLDTISWRDSDQQMPAVAPVASDLTPNDSPTPPAQDDAKAHFIAPF